MWIRVFFFAVLLSPIAGLAQEEPMSAIDWLSQSVREKPTLTPEKDESGGNAAHDTIEVTPLAAIRKDSVGLLPASVTGLPPDFWANSQTTRIVELIRAQSTNSLPEILSLLYTIMLAELDAPTDDPGNSVLLLARTDKLLDLGALPQAQALLERAGPNEAEIFRRWFDVSLLTGRSTHACTAMRAAPGFAPTLQAQVFCLARSGDWNAAALTLATGETLGFVTTEQADLMSRFLDPGMFEGELEIPVTPPLTPLDFTMREAIALSRPSGALPLAFVNADLDPSAAWRNQLSAAERLVRSQALQENHLIDLYTGRQPAASGGVWDRVAAIQALDVALLAGDQDGVVVALPRAYRSMAEVGLEVAFAKHYGERLKVFPLSDTDAHSAALSVQLLSPDFEKAGETMSPRSPPESFLLALSRGQILEPSNGHILETAIAAAFRDPLPEGALKSLLRERKLGEAVLEATLLLKDEAFADPGDIQAALAAFRAVGLESEARRIALQLLILDRRG